MKRIVFLFAVLLLAAMSAFAQPRTVTGKVTDETGAPVPFATITEAGTKNATTADANGSFSLRIGENGRLIVTSTGFKEASITPSGATADLTMTKAAEQLKEVVVTALGVQREKRALGYSTQQVSGNDLNKGQNTNPLAALQGKIAGVNITTGSNTPGSSTRVVLRGGSSITGNNQPLIVVDGIPTSNDNFFVNDGASVNRSILNNQVDYGNEGNDINPEDIENISVLKGPAATALYGQNASNGAVIITTKRGGRGASKNMRLPTTQAMALKVF